MPSRARKSSNEPAKKRPAKKAVPEFPRSENKLDPATHFKRLEGFPNDDIGNGQRLVELFGSDLRYIQERGTWAVHDGVDWRLDEELATSLAKRTVQKMQEESADDLSKYKKELDGITDKRSLAYARAKLIKDGASDYARWAAASGSAGKVEAMLKMARSEPRITASILDFDNDPAVLNCANGVLVLSEDPNEVKLRPKDRDKDLCLLTTGVPYDPKASCPRWDEYLETFFPSKDVRHWAQKLIGASLFGANTERILVIGWGGTTSGKSIMISTAQKALGKYCGPFPLSVLRDNQDERPRADLMQALPRRIVFADEASEASRLHVDQIKRLTGGTTVTARAPHAKESIEREPAFTPWIMTNDPPEIAGNDEALRRRLMVVPFMVSIKKDDPSYKRRLLADKLLPTAFLAWAVEGWKAYVREGLIDTAPAEAELTKADLITELSDMDRFLNEACIVDKSAREATSKLYSAYEIWAETNGIRGHERLTGTQFARALHKRGFEQKPIRDKEVVHKYRLGIKLNKDWQRTSI